MRASHKSKRSPGPFSGDANSQWIRCGVHSCPNQGWSHVCQIQIRNDAFKWNSPPSCPILLGCEIPEVQNRKGTLKGGLQSTPSTKQQFIHLQLIHNQTTDQTRSPSIRVVQSNWWTQEEICQFALELPCQSSVGVWLTIGVHWGRCLPFLCSASKISQQPSAGNQRKFAKCNFRSTRWLNYTSRFIGEFNQKVFTFGQTEVN